MSGRQTPFPLINEGKIEDAALLYERQAAESPRDLMSLYGLALARFYQKRYDDARALIEQGLSMKSDWAAGHYHLGHILHILGQNEAAKQELTKALAIDPTLADAHYVLGLVWDIGWRPEDKVRARRHFAEAAALKPEWALAHYKYAVQCGYSSLHEEALVALRRAVALKPDYFEAHFDLGYILLEQRQYKEALPHLERAIGLNPEHPAAREAFDTAKQAMDGGERRKPVVRFPMTIDDFADPSTVIREHILTGTGEAKGILTRDSRILTFGSCFARHLAMGVQRHGVAATTFGCNEEVNSTYANRYMIEWACGIPTHAEADFQRKLGQDQRQKIRQNIESADLIIYSLGVAPCFFDRDTGDFVWPQGLNMNILFMLKKYEFRTTSVAENVSNLRGMIETIRRINPGVHIVLTVSPVPLKASFEHQSAVIADCVSKSILRVAVHEILQAGFDRLHYWPSFEMVKWIGGHVGRVFGTDDQSAFHVSLKIVNEAMDQFIRVFGDHDLIEHINRAQKNVA